MAARTEAALQPEGSKGENSWPNLRIVYFCRGHYADDRRVLGQIRDICYRGHVWHSCLVGEIKSWTEYLWRRRIYYRLDRNAISRAKEPRPVRHVSPRASLIHGSPSCRPCFLQIDRWSIVSTISYDSTFGGSNVDM